MAKRFTRRDGESMRDFQARCNATLAEERVRFAPVSKRRIKTPRREWSREADRIDGYDRDDIGESYDR